MCAERQLLVMVAESSEISRLGLVTCLAQQPELRVVDAPATCEELFSILQSEQIGIVIGDLKLNAASSLEVAKRIKELSPYTSVIVFTARKPTPLCIGSCFLNGIAGILQKTVSCQEVAITVQAVFSGEAVMNLQDLKEIFHSLSSSLLSDAAQTNVADSALHGRQSQVLQLAARGLGNKEIATRLAISEHTVQSHLGVVFKKLGVTSRSEAIAHSLASGIISLSDITADYH